MRPPSNGRIRGLRRAIAVMGKLLGPGSVELVDVAHLDWSEKGAEAWVRDFVRKGARMDALWAANDPMALGAITALREAGYRSGADVMVGGLDWNQGAIERVLNGEMVLTHGGHFLLGAWAAVVLPRPPRRSGLRRGGRPPAISMGASICRWRGDFRRIGKVDWRTVDFTRFSKTRNPAVTRYNFPRMQCEPHSGNESPNELGSPQRGGVYHTDGACTHRSVCDRAKRRRHSHSRPICRQLSPDRR